jgi:hypothetical protein
MTTFLSRLAGTAPAWWLALCATPLTAQLDYRNLDDDRPTRVEDAYPVERYAFELILPYGLERERGGATLHFSSLELAYGIGPNGHIGVKVPVAALRSPGDTNWGVGGVRIFTLYNFNTETPWLPAFSLRSDVVFKAGPFGPDQARLAVKGILTRSWGRTRLHLNGGYGFGHDDFTPALVDPVERWWAGAALDRTLVRQSTLLLGEVYVAQAVAGEPVELNWTLGVRYQWRPSTVLDLGIGRRIGDTAGPDVALSIGLSQTFAIAPLMPRGR